MNKALSPERRAESLVNGMTLDQKIAELYGRGNNNPQFYNVANAIPAVPELCLPALTFSDAGMGVTPGYFTTVFPSGLTQASSWDRRMQRELGAALGREARAKGVTVQLAPGVGIVRHPLAGRNFEYPGEDPYLNGQVGAQFIKGVQSQGVATTVKHFALNDQEINRETSSSDADERTMQEIHLPPFEAAVNAGVASVMCSYNKINSIYACENPLLTSVLKKQFGFDGWVMSDWNATHSTVASALAGLDQEMGQSSGQYFSAPLKEAVLNGEVPESRVDDMVKRVFTPLFRLGIIDNPPTQFPEAVTAVATNEKSVHLSFRAATDGSILLKNDGILPIEDEGLGIALIGRPVGPMGARNFYAGGGSSRVPPEGRDIVSPLQGVSDRAAEDGSTVLYADGTSVVDAVAAATASDVAIVFAGESQVEGRDRPGYHLNNCVPEAFGGGICVADVPPSQDDLIETVAQANPNTIVVLQNGNPVAMPWISSVRAVLEMWYPGQTDGEAAAALLFGDINPSGKLTVTFPESLADSPMRSEAQYPGVTDSEGVPRVSYDEGLLVGYRWYDAKGIEPLFPFGFGLSYTRFRYSDLTLSRSAASFTLTNVGDRRGAEVAQVYVSSPQSAQEPPKQLKGYEKVRLAPGESRRLTISLDERAFQHWDERWKTARGCFTIRVGGSSADLPLRGRIARRGATC